MFSFRRHETALYTVRIVRITLTVSRSLGACPEQVVYCRCPAGMVLCLPREFEMVRVPLAPEHDPVKAIVVLELVSTSRPGHHGRT